MPMLFTALLLLPQKPPEILFLEQPFNWIQTLVSVLQIMFLGFLTFYTFRSNANQKIAERQAGWYHKLVVDPMIDVISTFFDEAEDILCSAAKLAAEQRSAKKSGIGAEARKKIAAFKKKHFQVSRDLQYRIEPFGPGHAQRIEALMEEFENVVTGWFEKESKAAPHDAKDDLIKALKEAEVGLFKELIDIEFETWGRAGLFFRRSR
jgi:hypothetical protein